MLYAYLDKEGTLEKKWCSEQEWVKFTLENPQFNYAMEDVLQKVMHNSLSTHITIPGHIKIDDMCFVSFVPNRGSEVYIGSTANEDIITLVEMTVYGYCRALLNEGVVL
jgi:hypothetical protein